MNEQVLVFAVDEASYYKEDHIGVRKKVEGQLAAFEKNGIKAELMPYTWKNGLPTINLRDDVTILYFRRKDAWRIQTYQSQPSDRYGDTHLSV